MNKGLEIRNRKLKSKMIKRNAVVESQENVCQFVTMRYEVVERINGKYKRTGNKTINGLQIKNRVYLDEEHYKLINSKSVKIIQIWNDVPEWANEELIAKYVEKKKQ